MKSFKLNMDSDWFKKDDIIYFSNIRAKVISTPKKTWWRVLFEKITFGLYKAPTYYKVKPIDNMKFVEDLTKNIK